MNLKLQLNLYTWIWVLYLLQGIIYPEGVIGQLLFLIIMGFSFHKMMMIIPKRNNPKFFSFLTMLVALYFIYGTIRIINGHESEFFEDYSTLTYIKTYMLSLCPIYVYYYFARKGVLDEDWFRRNVFIFLFLTIAIFMHNQFQRILTLDRDEITNNVAYSFVAMLPLFLFWYKKPIIQYLLLIVVVLFVVFSMKRGAVLVFAISIIPFLLYTFRSSSKRTKNTVIACIFLLTALTCFTVQKMIDSSDLFRLRIEQTLEGNSSNRDIIYEALWTEFSNNYSVIEYLLGRGADASIEISGKLAHNDWLETIIDQGLLGVFFFFLFWFSMYSTRTKMKKGKLERAAMSIVFISGFSRTLFSMSIGQMPFFYSSVLGYCLYLYGKEAASMRFFLDNCKNTRYVEKIKIT